MPRNSRCRGHYFPDDQYSVAFDSGLAWPQPVPEPAPIALLGAGMALAGWMRWRKRAGA
jgi:hypothetical protein